MDKVRIVNNSFGGGLWLAAWLFTVGYLHLPFVWKGIFALILWSYYLGVHFAPGVGI